MTNQYPASSNKRLMKLSVSSDGECFAQPDVKDLQRIYDKLYEYEEAEAQSLLIKLRVPLGTTVFVLKKACYSIARQSLLTQQTLSTACPFYDSAFCCCQAAPLSNLGDKSLSMRPENNSLCVDDECLKRFYLMETSFTIELNDDKSIYLSKEEAFSRLNHVSKVLRENTSAH